MIVEDNVMLWLVVLLLSTGITFACIEVMLILIRDVLVTHQIVAENVCSILRRLQCRTRLVLMRSRGLMKDAHALVQHLNPSCRAARHFAILPVARFLISIADRDLSAVAKTTHPHARNNSPSSSTGGGVCDEDEKAAADVGSSQDNDFVLHLSHLHQYLDHNYLPCCWGLFRLKDNHDHYIDWMADTAAAVAAAVTGNMLDVDVEAAYDPYTTSSDYHIGTAADTAA